MKKRVAAYARVSTAMKGQEHSFEFQSEYWNTTLGNNPDYYYVGLFADKGISGKFASRRPQFMSMISAAKQGKIDIIFCKSVQRFSRNASELLSYVRELREVGVAVVFEKEKINTIEDKTDLYLTIAAAVAEDDLSRYSQNVTWTMEEKAKKGEGSFGGRLFGYYVQKGNKVEINEEEAKIIRMIFKLYLESSTTGGIVNKLYSLKVKSPKGNDKWQLSCVLSILKNEKYCGDMKLQKFYSKNGTRYVNRGEKDSYYVENHHTPIIDKDTFNKVQDEIKRRSKTKLIGKPTNIYPFTGLITCGVCGEAFQHHVSNSGTEYAENYWRCKSGKTFGGVSCGSSQIKDSVLKEKFVDAYNDFVTNDYKGIVEQDYLDQIDEALKEFKEVEKLYLNGWIKKDSYEAEKIAYQNKEKMLRGKIDALMIRRISPSDYKTILEFDETKLEKFIDKVEVHNYLIKFYFFNGVVLERKYTNRKKQRKDGLVCPKWLEE